MSKGVVISDTPQICPDTNPSYYAFQNHYNRTNESKVCLFTFTENNEHIISNNTIPTLML